LALQRIDDAHFVLGRNPREDVGAADFALQGSIVHLVQLACRLAPDVRGAAEPMLSAMARAVLG
jgi:hypothetical protein